MANKTLFQSIRGAFVAPATTRNQAGGAAYELAPLSALARAAATGCLSETFYASAETQLEEVLALAAQVDADSLAQVALYARTAGAMKDLPALLCAVLATRDVERLEEIFPRVINNGKMLRTFVQMVRSGVTGRKSMGSAPRRCVRTWLEKASVRQLLEASVGNDPSLADVVKMVHPRPADAEREAFYAWLLGRPYRIADLPESLRAFEAWKTTREGATPEVPFQLLTGLELGRGEWIAIAKNASWQTTRMNLNSFVRHGVFESAGMTRLVASRLANAESVRRARVFPYQLLAAYRSAGTGVPEEIREALQSALEIAVENVPEIAGSVVVCPDVSGSMSQSVTGYRRGATSAVRCIDVAALVTASILRKNRGAQVIPFEQKVVSIRLNARDSIMTNAEQLAAVGGGGTNCSAPLAQLNAQKAKPALVIYVSDNESWADPKQGRGTAMMAEWAKLKQRHPQARLVCIDLTPHTTTQAYDREDILNVAGFSDRVFDLIASFAAGSNGVDHWINEIKRQSIQERLPMK
jgi:60 kDa SS-A/Ro ribonucleoprotein